MRHLIVSAALLLAFAASAMEVGWVEDYVLSQDRQAALGQLSPGSEEHRYWSCITLQHAGKLDEVDRVLADWRKQHRHSDLAQRIELRQAALRLGQDQGQALTVLCNTFSNGHHHQQPEREVTSHRPTMLDAQLLSWEQVKARGHQYSDLRGFSDAALERLFVEGGATGELRHLLDRLHHANHDGIERAIVTELKQRDSAGFGHLKVHGLLTIQQLEQCLRLLPSLRDDEQFITAWLRRLLPAAGVDLERNPVEHRAWLERVWAYVQTLPQAQASLQAQVLQELLALDLADGRPDRERFLAWLKLPRQANWVNPELRKQADRRIVVHEGWQADHTALPLPPVTSDHQLLAAYLDLYLRGAADTSAFDPWLERWYLKRAFISAKLLAGIGNETEWAARMGDAAWVQNLKDRVDLEFLPGNPEQIAPGQEVALRVAIKNVPELMVRLYAVDTVAWHRQHGEEVATDIELGGLVPNHEQVLTYGQAPLRRHEEALSLPAIQGRGVWVVELIGNGRASRAVIRVGDFTADEQPSTAGQRFQLRDEAGQPLPLASIWLQGRQFEADELGSVLLPFSTEPGQRLASIEQGGCARPLRFTHLAENYQLEIGAHVDAEALLPGAQATVVLHPRLLLNNLPVGMSRLADVTLHITAIDADGVRTEQVVRDVKIEDGKDLVQVIRAPERLRQLAVRLSARQPRLTAVDPEALEATWNTTVGGAGGEIAQWHLERRADGYALRCLGRNGEPIAGQRAQIGLSHRLLADGIAVDLETDASGRILLGSLPEVTAVQVQSQSTPGLSPGLAHVPARQWALDVDRTAQAHQVHLAAGGTALLPYHGAATAVEPLAFACYELRGEVRASDQLSLVKLDAGSLQVGPLPAGDYELVAKDSGQSWRILVEAGAVQGTRVLGAARRLELAAAQPVHVVIATVLEHAAPHWPVNNQGRSLWLQLANADAHTRVHVFARHFVQSARGEALLGRPLNPAWELVGAPPSHYLDSRAVGDEERYILARRNQQQFPGNLLEKPSLLLNPVAIGETSRQEVHGDAGGEFGERSGGGRHRATGAYGGRDGQSTQGCTTDLDFLAAAPTCLLNLKPDANGVVTAALNGFDGVQELQVVVVHPLGGSVRAVPLPAIEPAIRDRRLAKPLDPAVVQARQPASQALEAGAALVIPDIGQAELRAYSSLGEVFALLSALQPAAVNGLEELLQWPNLSKERKAAFYREHACHEVHLFLYAKDRDFFTAVIKPYLASKRDKDFLDAWLLDLDLAPWLRPEAWARLNAAERALATQRLPAQRDAVLRWLDGVLELTPPDPAATEHRFRTALAGKGMNGQDGGFDLFGAKDKVDQEEKRERGVAMTGPVGSAASAVPPAAPQPATSMLDPTNAPKPEGRPARDAAGGREVSLERLEMATSKNSNTLLADELAAGAADGEMRKMIRPLYRALDPTRIWAESRFKNIPLAQQSSELVAPNAYWRALAATEAGQPFRSPAILDACRSPTEVWLALAVLDLPFTATAPTIAIDGRRLTLTAQTPALVFASDIRPAEVDAAQQLLVNQTCFDALEPQIRQGSRQVLNVPAELVAGHPYGQRVVLTNPTPERLQLNLLIQIPQGSLPLDGGRGTRVEAVVLDAYQTTSRDVHFYWPGEGSFAQHPASAATTTGVIGRGEPQALTVLAQPSRLDTGRWDYVAGFGTQDQVLAWLATGNLDAVDLSLCAWRLKERAAYDAITGMLGKRMHWDDSIHGYAFLHGDQSGIAAWLRRHPDQAERLGPALEADWVSLDPVDLKRYEHLEFAPLVNPRAHQFTGRRQIENQDFAQQYHRLLETLAHQPRLDAEDRLALVQYLLSQDRVAEAIAQFAAIDPGQVVEKLPYDYCACYLAVSKADLATAKTIASRHKDHGIERWQRRFASVLAQIAEIESGQHLQADPRSREGSIESSAEQAPSLELEVVDGEIRLEHRNLSGAELRCYPMNVELLFSRDPFLGAAGLAQAALIKANHTSPVVLGEGGRTALPVPEALRDRNLLIEVAGGGLRRTATVLSSRLAVRTVAEYGQVQAADRTSDKPLAGVYIKVYRKEQDGTVHFHKDGYTDLRGRFDYATVSGEGGSRAARYAVLVLDDQRGAVIREVEPPLR